ncbi:hypothetical protein D3C75_1162090 [compost metagenome]
MRHTLVVSQHNALPLFNVQMVQALGQFSSLLTQQQLTDRFFRARPQVIQPLLFRLPRPATSTAQPINSLIAHNVRQPGQWGAEIGVIAGSAIPHADKAFMQHLFSPGLATQ